MEETKGLNSSLELGKSVSEKHLDLLRPSSRYYSMFKGILFLPCKTEQGVSTFAFV